MARLAVICFGSLVLALAAVAGLDAFTAPSITRTGGSRQMWGLSGVHLEACSLLTLTTRGEDRRRYLK